MRISKKILAGVLAALMAISMMPFTAFAVDAGASDIQAALNAGGNITLTEDLSSNISVPSGVSVVLDLNNHTVSAVITNNGTLTIKNGTVVKNGMYFPNEGFGTYAIMNNGVMTLENITCTGAIVNKSTAATPSMTINSGTYHGTPLAVASVSGSTTEINGGTFTDQGFVTAYSGSTIVFNDGSVSSVLGYGNGGSLVVNGGYVSTITHEDDGDTPASIEINGGSFNATYYDSEVKQYVDSSLNVVDNGDGTYSVVPAVTYVAKVGSDYYATFEEAVAAARTGSDKTVTCVSDFEVIYPEYNNPGSMHYIDITGVTVDLNGHNMTIGSRFSTLFCGANGKIMNGTCTGTDCTKWPNYKYGLYIWGTGSGDVRNSTGARTNITLEKLTCNYGIHLWNADATIIDCDVTGSASYYAVWADECSEATIESGNFTSNGAAVLGCATSSDGEGHINVKGGNFTVPSGKPLVLAKSSSSKPENAIASGGFYHYANGNVYTVNAENLANGYIQDMTTGKVYANNAVDTMSITVEDNIDLNIYVADPNNEIKTITYSYNGAADKQQGYDEVSKTVAAKKNADGKINLSVDLAPAQIMDNITVVKKNAAGETVGEPIETSIADYCNTIINSTGFTNEMKDLAKSTLDYGKAASDYFSYNTYAYAGYVTKLADPTAAINAISYDSNEYAGGVYAMNKVSYVATSTPELRFYLADTNKEAQNFLAAANADLTCNIGKAQFVKDGANNFILQIKGIDITDFGKQIEVSIDRGFDDFTILKYTPIHWVKAAIGSGETNLVNLGKGIGNYYLKSVAYFGKNA